MCAVHALVDDDPKKLTDSRLARSDRARSGDEARVEREGVRGSVGIICGRRGSRRRSSGCGNSGRRSSGRGNSERRSSGCVRGRGGSGLARAFSEAHRRQERPLDE